MKKLVLKSLSLTAKKQVTAAGNTSFMLRIYARASEESSATQIKFYSVTASSTSNTTTTRADEEIDLSGYGIIDYVELSANAGSGTGYLYQYNLKAEFDLYF